MDYAGERDLLPQHMDRKGDEGRREYRGLKNATSIDGLPAFDYDLERAPVVSSDESPDVQPTR
jgi:hypothetical protein